MSAHLAIKSGNLAIITGGASGIGLAAAKYFARNGMHVVISDIDEPLLGDASAAISKESPNAKVYATKVDVSNVESVQNLRRSVLSQFPDTPVGVLMCNAGVGGPTKASNSEGWDRIIGTNMFGVINGCQTFIEDLKKHKQPALVINTGSKQGITTPPASGAAYNVSKAGVKTFTEQLAWELRQDKESQIDIKLLIPGWVHTGLTGAKSGKPKPDGAWTPEQTVEFMIERIRKGSFYILCPDNETKRELDLARMEWNINDILQDRPALSRWHPDYSSKFDEFVKAKGL